MAALLRGSPPNQLMFRETGFLAQLPALLRLPADGAGAGAELAPQKAANLVAAMDVVLALLPPAGADPAAPVCASAAENRQALLQRGLLGVLEGLALQQGGAPDEGVRAQVRGCGAAEARAALGTLRVCSLYIPWAASLTSSCLASAAAELLHRCLAPVPPELLHHRPAPVPPELMHCRLAPVPPRRRCCACQR